MSLFQNESTVIKLQKKSKNIIDVFTKTASQLDEVNIAIAEEVEAKELAKRELENEITSLGEQATVNSRISANIKAIVN